MAVPNKKGWMAVFFILTCLAIPFGITYYVSTDNFKTRFSRFQAPMPSVPEDASLEKTRTIDDQVVLVRGERIRIHNTSLVFKGIDRDRAVLDLFLEELDREHPYPQAFPKDIAGDKLVRFGDVSYQVVSVRDNTLVLKVYHTMETR